MAQLKRFENKAQLIRRIHSETGVSIGELWEQYESEVLSE